jgi:hypothetical protein
LKWNGCGEKYTHKYIFDDLHGCETWSLTLREEHRLGVCKNRVLREVSVPEREEVTAKWG